MRPLLVSAHAAEIGAMTPHLLAAFAITGRNRRRPMRDAAAPLSSIKPLNRRRIPESRTPPAAGQRL